MRSNIFRLGASTHYCMTKNGAVLSVIAVILAAIYVSLFTDWFQKQSIQIIPQIRYGRPSSVPRGRDKTQVCPVSFYLNGQYKLTSVKVFAESDLATNKYPTPLWHLVSDSNSVPTRSIVYGLQIKGMRPAVEQARPEPLQPEVKYVLQVEVGKIKGKTNFWTKELLE